MAGSHVLVHSLDGLSAGHLAVLLVHVVGTGAGVVADPDAEVLDLEGVLLVDLWTEMLESAWLDFSPHGRVEQDAGASPSSCRILNQVLNGTYHVDADDLTSGLLDLLQTAHEVPVTGLGDNIVGGKDAHAVQSRGGVGLCRQVPADDLILLETTWLRNMLASASWVLLKDPEARVLRAAIVS